MEHKYQHTISLFMVIYPVAKSLFNEVNATDPDMKVPSFAVSARWFEHISNL
jgi:hypothetical protein